jgi:hypothetical protein
MAQKAAGSSLALIKGSPGTCKPNNAGSRIDRPASTLTAKNEARSSKIQINASAIQRFLQASIPTLLSPAPAIARRTADSDCSKKTKQPGIRFLVY